MLVLLLACTGTIPDGDPPKGSGIEHVPGDTDAVTDTGDTDADTDADSDTDADGDTDTDTDTDTGGEDTYEPQPYDTSPFDCATEIAPLPVTTSVSLTMTNGEDFTFLSDGRVATVDFTGKLLVYAEDGTQEFLRPGVGYGGMAQLPDGDIVIAERSNNRIVRVSMDGAMSTIATAKGSTNGLRVGPDGMIYYDEGNGGAWKVDPSTGDTTLITDDLYAPNGIVVDNDGVVYIGDDYGWMEIIRPKGDGTYHTAALYADLPGVTSLNHDCEWRNEGDACTVPVGYNVKTGSCRSDGAGGLACDGGDDLVPCDGLVEGDPCETEYFGTVITQTCHTNSDGDLFCPRESIEREEACGSSGDPCTTAEGDGRCVRGEDKIIACARDEESRESIASACELKVDGDPCDIVTTTDASPGECTTATDGALICRKRNVPSANPVDGIDLDECGQLYASSFYGYGTWRWTGPGSTPEDLMDRATPYSLTSMRFGRLGAGFDNRTLYLWARDQGLIAVDVGVPGLQSR